MTIDFSLRTEDKKVSFVQKAVYVCAWIVDIYIYSVFVCVRAFMYVSRLIHSSMLHFFSVMAELYSRILNSFM